ncbi:SUKH-4 family immunity protein [Streptomyces sp. NPDC048507]|uniref:SUKH-4 family immunity protein n=1 Tax=Streptomyces sp. NPDC048507 TaxID=3365560 RepID=UPI003722150F
MPRDDLASAGPAPGPADALFASPAALLDAGADRARALAASAGGVGREVFAQAEAVFGRAPVSRAEFASWLHFAAGVLGRRAYAEETAAAEPGMPWRTVWAWWRPVGAHRAEPNLSGDRSAEVFDARDPAAGPLLKVWSAWTTERWFDLATGARRPAPASGTYLPREAEPDEAEPFLFDGDEEGWALHRPGTWEEPLPLGGGRFLLVEARGVLVAERNAAVTGWPRGGPSCASWEAAGGEPWFLGPGPAASPLDAARLEAVFGAPWVVRAAPSRLPAALTHAPSRAFLTGTGLPRHWAAGVASFALGYGEEGPGPAAGDPDGLLYLGVFDLGYADRGRVLLDGRTGTVLVSRNGAAPVRLTADAETFVRLLEAVRRFMGACWDPYPAEDGAAEFRREAAALDPAVLDTAQPAGELWEHLFASVTELGVDGY